ncbi:ATP-binding cassette domain-containing protein [Nonomuraea terrae]|uniref:ABC transporter ATP-binding protein n=1 Tax=Nonomuraea terrae TaxID=2530383 RepID=UPI0037A7BF79
MQLTRVSFRYRKRDRLVISHADARLSAGDVVELTGANGAGKSTLLRLLAGLARPSSGVIADRPAVVGFAPDRFPTAQPFTVTTYLRHMSRVRGDARWEPWAERLGLGPLLHTALRDLSKGSAHKVGLVQALMAGPGLLILDEPFAGLDADTREALPAIAAELAERGAIVIAADHQSGLRDLPALRHWTLQNGHLHESTSPLTLPATPAVTAGTPQRPGTAEAAGQVTVAVTLPAGDLPCFLARMRDEGYLAREIEESH